MATSLRQKRQGMTMHKRPEPTHLGVEELHKLSHNRGLSHGSAVYNGLAPNGVVEIPSPAISPAEADLHRPSFVRRLSSLPEDKRKSRALDPYANFARVLVYSMQQLHRPIKDLIGIASDGSLKRSNLDRIFADAFASVEILDRQLVAVENYSEEHDRDDNGSVSTMLQGSGSACARSAMQLVSALQRNVRNIVHRGNPLYVRSLMHLLYAGLVEVRNACIKLEGGNKTTPKIMQRDVSRGRALPSTPGRPTTSMRVRDDSTFANGVSRSNSLHRPLNLASLGTISAGSRSASMTSLNQAVLRPPPLAEAFPGMSSFNRSARSTRSNTLVSVEEMEEEQQFERIFLQMSNACQYALQALPRCNSIFSHYRQVAAEQRGDQTELSLYDGICDRCGIAIEAADALSKRLETVRLRDPSVRGQLDFWQLCTAFSRVSTVPSALPPSTPHDHSRH